MNRACASVERMVAPNQAPGKTRSSAYLAAPVSLAGPSRRSGAAPLALPGTIVPGWTMTGVGASVRVVRSGTGHPPWRLTLSPRRWAIGLKQGPSGYGPWPTSSRHWSVMNDLLLTLLTILVAVNIALTAFVVLPAIVRQRRERRFADSLQLADSSLSADDRIYSPARALVDDGPAANRADALTGLLLPGEWNRILGDEDARVRRYSRPATVVIIEVDGLDRLTSALGMGAGDRVTQAVADTLSRHARAADQLARIDTGRFGVLLPETGEVEAVNYVERVRSACDLWLESGAIALRLAIGWAASPVNGTLGDALTAAEERIEVELRHSVQPDAPAPAPVPQTTTDLAGWPSTA